MRRNNTLTLFIVALMFCSLFLLTAGTPPAQANGGNLADGAVAFIKSQYRATGAQSAPVRLPLVLYILNEAGVDTNTSEWVYNGVAIGDAVNDLVDQDISDPATPVKSLAQDLIAMQGLGDVDRASQLQALLTGRQHSDGSFEGEDPDYGAYSILPAYDLLGRADRLGIIDAVYARTYILAQRDATTGAWPFIYLDFMSTAEAVRALACLDPGEADQAAQDAIDAGCAWLRQQQQTDGSFQAGMDVNLIDTVEAIAAQKALNIDPASAGGWKHQTSGKSAVDYLNSYDLAAGGNLMDAVWLLDACNLLGIRPTGGGGSDGGGGSSSSISVGVAVVGRNDQKLLAPTYVTLGPGNRWGLTALGALDAAAGSSSYVVASGTYGYWVTGIYDLANATPPSTAGWMYTLNDAAPSQGADVTKVSNGDRVIWYYSESMDQSAPTWTRLSGSGSDGGTTSVTSTNGNATITPSAGGAVSLGGDASIKIPPGALNGTAGVNVTVQKLDSPPAAPSGFMILGSVYEFSVGGSTSYDFNKPVTLALTFDPEDLAPGQTPSVYYYDQSTEQWVNLGGAVSGNTITITIDHFTKFAVLAREAGEEAEAPPQGPAPAFSDVSPSYWAYDVISQLNSAGYVYGYPDNTFKPDNAMTRAEFAAVLDKVLKLPAYNPATPDFSDVSPRDWFYGSVENTVYAGLVKGYGQTFAPNNQITREELATVLVRALNGQDQAGAGMSVQTDFTDDSGISGWARGYVAAAVENGLLRGYPDNSFRAKSSATRAEVCALIANFLDVRK